MLLNKLFTSRITLILSFLLLAAGLVAGVTLIRYPQLLFPKAAEVQCPSATGPFDLYCTWDAPTDAVSYDYSVLKQTADGGFELVKTETGIADTHAVFDGYPNETYTCSVYAYNDCGSKSQLAAGSPFSCTAPAPTPQTPQWAKNGVWQDPWQDPDGGMRWCAVQTWFTQPQEEVQHLRVEIWPDFEAPLNGLDRYRVKDFTKEEIRNGQVPNSMQDAEGRFNVQFLDAIIKNDGTDEGWQAKVTAFSEGDASESSIQMSWGNHPTCRGNNMPSTSPTPVDCRPRNCQDENASWLDKVFYFIPDIPGSFSDSNCTQSITDLTNYCTTTAETGTISARVAIDNPSNRDVEFVKLNIKKDLYESGCSTQIDDIRPSDINSGTFTYTRDQPVDGCELIVGETWKLCALLKTSDDSWFQDPAECGLIGTYLSVTVGDIANFHFTIPAAEEQAIVHGDISGPEGEPDGVVDAADVSVLMTNWGVPFGFNPRADLNNDGQVDALDASLLIQDWSES